MSEGWITVIGLAALTVVLRASGPMVLGHRRLPDWAPVVISLLPGALLTAMVVVQTFGGDNQIVVDERLAGVAVAGGVLALNRRAMVPAMLAAMAATALLRWLI